MERGGCLCTFVGVEVVVVVCLCTVSECLGVRVGGWGSCMCMYMCVNTVEKQQSTMHSYI